MIYLSYLLDQNTPSYGNRNPFIIEQKSVIAKGDRANDSYIKTTVHIGTHIDMPYHFHEHGQTIENFPASFWQFHSPLIIEVEPSSDVLCKEIIDVLVTLDNLDKCDFLIIKTGICHQRDQQSFWQNNYGFAPELADYMRANMPNLRVLGFDSISLSSFQQRDIGKQAHEAFLDPACPILILEDMDLTQIDKTTNLSQVIISPIRIARCDGLPCTVFGWLND